MSGRFKLSGGDGLSLMMSDIAAGNKIPGITEEENIDDILGLLTPFLDNCRNYLSEDPQIAARKAYMDIQCTLMAYRKDDFVTIQKEAQFSRQGEANFASLLAAYNEGGKNKLREKLAEEIGR